MAKLSFKPKTVVGNMLGELSGRTRDVLESRFGLGKTGEKKTLERIGKQYNITRERVRQIENFAIASLKKSGAYEREQRVFDELRDVLEKEGAVLPEDDILNILDGDMRDENHLYFLLVLGSPFTKHKETKDLHRRWSVDNTLADRVHKALHSLAGEISDQDLVAETEMLKAFRGKLGDVPPHFSDDTVLSRWLRLSKRLGRNHLGEWGLADSPNIRIRGIRDYAYLVIRHHGSPLHFAEVAKLISEMFSCPAHPATCHNELIKDKERFVLVGRGLYGLAEWGYTDGVVRDVITNLLKNHGPMRKDELVNRVLKERHVKENTVVVNLQNKKHFKRDADGYYSLA